MSDEHKAILFLSLVVLVAEIGAIILACKWWGLPFQVGSP